ncbi:hypothetical protein [Thiocapsa sp.]|uniref:hypothetical protein n=1 Tax=Thiocapsa sp. TaxID=2024551 RepID=UPI0035935A5C
MAEQIALRFPEGTRDRIKALARDGESMTALVLRALAAMEGQCDRQHHNDAGRDQGELDTLSVRLAALERRITALERFGSTSKPDSSEPGAVAGYPVEARDMALGMQARGCTPAEIRVALEKAVGRSPGPKHLATALRRWSGQASVPTDS